LTASAGTRDDSGVAEKNYVLDTNVLLHDPNAMFAFEDNHVIIPIYVIEEIDNFKKDQSELGRNAREVARLLDALRDKGGLAQGVSTDGGGVLRVALGPRLPPAEHAWHREARSSQRMDNLILDVALAVRKQESDRQTILVTKDVNMRVRGDALGLKAVDYDAERISIDELYLGAAELDVEADVIEAFYADGGVELDASLVVNQYVVLKSAGRASQTALARFDGEKAVPIRKLPSGVWGVRPRNKEQHFALDLLLNDDIKVVTLVGKAGTGKTLVALAAGLQKALEEQLFHKLLVARPIFPLGRDIGYLPGDIEEKLNPWMQPIYDNLEFLLGFGKQERRDGRSPTELFELGYIEIEPLTYIRGRSLPNVFMIIDEAQNLTPHEVKTIITRAGDGTKIVLTGDPYQIDNPYIDASNNGLTTVVERFKGQGIAGHVTLTKGERSELAELATQLL
jgi:PhoH-like ATPase